MLASVIPTYNYLLDGLVEYCNESNNPNDIVVAVNAGIKKLEGYYEKTDDTTIYTIATGKLSININYLNKLIIIFIILLII